MLEVGASLNASASVVPTSGSDIKIDVSGSDGSPEVSRSDGGTEASGSLTWGVLSGSLMPGVSSMTTVDFLIFFPLVEGSGFLSSWKSGMQPFSSCSNSVNTT